MKKRSVHPGQICFCAGAVLILASVLLLALWQGSAFLGAKRSRAYADTLRGLISEPRSAVMEPRTNNSMPSLCVDNQDFVALIEMPVSGAALPVGASWNSRSAYPCRYDGSVYDGSLMIGTTNQKGQFDFAREISVGNSVYITDMTGDRFSFVVSDIRYSEHADNDSLRREESDLTIFIKNVYAFEYIIVYCAAGA